MKKVQKIYLPFKKLKIIFFKFIDVLQFQDYITKKLKIEIKGFERSLSSKKLFKCNEKSFKNL